jgi:hypothetical protein
MGVLCPPQLAAALVRPNMEGAVLTKDAYSESAEPEQVIAAMNRKRHMMVWVALAGIALALGGLFTATAAMYAKEPSGAIQTTKAALQPEQTAR